MTIKKTVDDCCGQGCDTHSNRNINANEEIPASTSRFSRFIAGYINLVGKLSKSSHQDWARKI